jgi:hypothetical protein
MFVCGSSGIDTNYFCGFFSAISWILSLDGKFCSIGDICAT